MKKRRGKGRRSEKEERQELIGREIAIMKVIKQNPDWHYSRLKDHFARNHIMAGQTFHDTIGNMLKEGKLLSIRKGPWNRKFYSEGVAGQTLDDKEFKKAMYYSLSIFEKIVTNMASGYQKLPRLEKATYAMSLFDDLFKNIHGLSLRQILGISTKVDCEAYENRFKDLIAKVIEMVRNDADSQTVYPVMMMRVLPTFSASEEKMKASFDRLLA